MQVGSLQAEAVGHGDLLLRVLLGGDQAVSLVVAARHQVAAVGGGDEQDERFRQRASSAPDLGLPIPTRKQAAYDHFVACQAYKKDSIPGANDPSEATSIRGLGRNPSLRECGPGER